jgi:N-acetyl-anhydromuramyl-L-alanine amidase AmpD
MHTLVKGETIWRLSETYGVKADEILRVNRIVNPSELKVGARIWIPGAPHPLRVLPFLPDTNRWDYIVIHHSATENGNAELFDKGHRRRGFWNGLGYHFVIDNGTSGTRDGQIETSHRWIHQLDGAHCNAADMNKIGIGICLVGNFDRDGVSASQLNSVAWLVRQLQAEYKIPASRVLRHRDVPGKDTHCPGARFPWNDLRKQLL